MFHVEHTVTLTTQYNPPTGFRKREFEPVRPFAVQASVIQNVRELRRCLGSVSKPLSLRDFAALVTKSHPSREISANTVDRWESGLEPDVASIAIMAELAGIGFAEFALGKDYKTTTIVSEGGVSHQVLQSIDLPAEELQGLTRAQLHRAVEADRRKKAAESTARKNRGGGKG